MFILEPMGKPGVCPAHLIAWTQEEDEIILKNRPLLTYREIANLLPRRSPYSVSKRAQHLRNRSENIPPVFRRYSKEEELFIRRNRHSMTQKQIAENLNRTQNSIAKKASQMGISLRKKGDLSPLTKIPDEDVELICALRDCGGKRLTWKQIGEKFGVSFQVARRLYRKRSVAADVVATELCPR